MIYEVFKSSKPVCITPDTQTELLMMLYNYCSRNEHIINETYDEFVQVTDLEFNSSDEFTKVNIISGIRYINSTIIYSEKGSTNTTFIHSNLTTVLLLFIESISSCVLVKSRIDPKRLFEMIVDSCIDRIGNIEIFYNVPNKNLNTISINIPQKDVVKLLPNVNLKLAKFIRDTTSLNLEKLEMIKFLSNGVCVLDSTTIKLPEYDLIALQVIHQCSI